MRWLFATSILAIVDILALPDTLQPSYNVNNTRQSDNGQRALLIFPRVPQRDSLHVKPPTKKCHFQKGQGRQLEDCDSEGYTIFSQTYMPTVMSRVHDREIKPDEVEDWNNNLKIRGLFPQGSQWKKSTLAFTPQAHAEINQYDWILKDDKDMYVKEWRRYGVKSGLSPIDYIREINHLHRLHKTPHFLQESRTEMSIPFTKLKHGFHPYACLLCKTLKFEKYFLGVSYCHKVNPITRHAETELVPFTNCGVCPARSKCNQNRVVIPKLKVTTCPSGACSENEYSIFAQSYMPTIMLDGKLNYRPIQPEQVDDWNRNFKIHTLWPKHYNVKPSTLPFTRQAAAAVDEKEWPSIRTHGRKVYEFQWDTNGRKSGLNPLEYVIETQRVHKLYPTPDLLKGVYPHEQIISLATLTTLFPPNACLVCRPNFRQQVFLALHLCFKVNSKTRKMEKIVPFSHCGSCSACTQDRIYFPKIKRSG